MLRNLHMIRGKSQGTWKFHVKKQKLWRLKAEVLEIKLRRIEATLKQSQEVGDKIKRSRCQLMSECQKLHDDTRHVLNKYYVEPVASKSQSFEEHFRELLESLENMWR
ncbi:hypothetical protein ACH5RR_007009 [Cinchona calisaya]|uniref:Uncharacterized protein n=1 Tax=Cinchona calisaya TaxID=153742 RepID=A0ABD3AQP1_9GENT